MVVLNRTCDRKIFPLTGKFDIGRENISMLGTKKSFCKIIFFLSIEKFHFSTKKIHFGTTNFHFGTKNLILVLKTFIFARQLHDWCKNSAKRKHQCHLIIFR